MTLCSAETSTSPPLLSHVSCPASQTAVLHLSCFGTVLTRQAAVARASALTRVAARTANPPKSYPQKTRGKKASAASSAEKEEDVIELD
jgi:hypothetical protein